MGEDEIHAIRQRAEAATPGPWLAKPYVESRPGVGGDVITGEVSRWGSPVFITHGPEGDCSIDRMEDVEFIAHAREDVPALLEEIKRLRAALEERA